MHLILAGTGKTLKLLYFERIALYYIGMGFYINNLDVFSKQEILEQKGKCQQCKTKPITGSRKKFCSDECGIAFHNNVNGKKLKDRLGEELECNWCGQLYTWSKGRSRFYCSTECNNQRRYKNNKSFSKADVSKLDTDLAIHSDAYRFDGWLSGHLIRNDKVNAALDTLPNKPYVWENLLEINRILMEELPPPRYTNGKMYHKTGTLAHWKSNFYSFQQHARRRHKNGKRKESMAIDEEKSSSDSPTKN